MDGTGTDDDRRLARERAFQRLAEQTTTSRPREDDRRPTASFRSVNGLQSLATDLIVALAVGAVLALAVIALGVWVVPPDDARELADPDVEYHDSGGGSIDREDPLVICFQRGEREDCVRQQT